MRGRAAVRIELTEAERAELASRLRRRKVARADATRAEIVLLAAAGVSNVAIAERLSMTRITVATWRNRFAARRMDGLLDEPRPGAPRTVGDEKVAEVVTATLETLPAGRTHWSARTMAKASGLAPSTVQRIWQAFSLQPHRSETFKLSADPLFIEKVRDIVGLYLNPPERALVLCVDEKSQIQALDRTQPLLPMRPGQAERRTHDYKRHGTTSLFAALDVKAGTVIGRCMPRHRAQEFRRFLDAVEKNVPRDLDIHVVMDNASSHKTKLIRDWFAKRPRWHVHYTPTSASWINQVERVFALLTDQQIRRGAHHSTAALEAAITAYINAHNAEPKPFRWSKTADDILASIERSASVRSPSKPNVDRNFGVRTLVPAFATRDPASGELRGVAMDLALALAARLGVEVVPVAYPSPPVQPDSAGPLKGVRHVPYFWGCRPVDRHRLGRVISAHLRHDQHGLEERDDKLARGWVGISGAPRTTRFTPSCGRLLSHAAAVRTHPNSSSCARRRFASSSACAASSGPAGVSSWGAQLHQPARHHHPPGLPLDMHPDARERPNELVDQR